MSRKRSLTNEYGILEMGSSSMNLIQSHSTHVIQGMTYPTISLNFRMYIIVLIESNILHFQGN